VLEQEMQKSAQEEKLRRSEEELADLYNNAPCGYHSLDKDGRFIKINDTELRMLGYSRGEVIGRMKLEEVMTPESAKRLRATFPSFLRNGGVKDLEFEFRNRNGATLNALVNATAVKNAAGEYQHSRSVVFDITERKRMEEELLSVNERLSEANKELEAFSYSVSHDLRAPLRGIAGFARILLEDHAPKLDAEARRVINVITGNTEKMGRLIDDLLAFSRVSRAEIACETVDMTALAREALGDAAQTRGAAGCAVPELLPAAGDRAMLKQVWANLLSNALKFTSKTPAPEITVSSARENGFTVYTVKDNGAGFDPAYASKLFGIFQRLHTEDEFEGTGVGLALCNRIITKHGGWMKAEGAAGKGAAFTFALPERKGSGT
jgi:PAS domain S-box-containing protein